MQPRHPPSTGNPAHAAATGPTATSPFISLAAQCDLLYCVGSQPHHYAVISEQSVFTRAAEQLRFLTPSPLTRHRASRSSPADLADAHDSPEASPRVCMVASPPPPFPSIRWFELSREAEEMTQQQQKQQTQPQPPQSSLPLSLLSTSSGATVPLRRQLVPSGTGLATCAFQNDYPANKSSLSQEQSGEGDMTALRGEQGGIVASSAAAAAEAAVAKLEGSAEASAAASTIVTFFPSAVLVRAVAQMVLTMQASKQNSAAVFSLARYCGASLPAWVRAAHQDPALAAKAADAAFHLRDTLVFSVAPQVVADHLAALQVSTTPQAGADAAPSTTAAAAVAAATVFYAVIPNVDTPLTSVSATAGKKRQRSEAAEGSAVEPLVMPGTVSCSRISGTSPSSSACMPISYAAMTPSTFQGLHQASRSAPHPAAGASPPSPADSTLYDDEAEWLTHGVLRRLFTLPASPIAGPASTASERAETEESRRGTYAAFLKTNAFLLLSFLVHYSWCLHIHASVAEALAARLAAQRTAPEAAVNDGSFVAIHIVCLPQLADVRRSPQHAWTSELTYRLRRAKQRGVSASAKTWAWQLTANVLNRNAELQWRLFGRLGGGACDALPDTTVEGSGTLDDLLKQL